MKQDITSYFVKKDETGKSGMDYFVERSMNFGADEELPVCPPPVKTAQTSQVTSKPQVQTKSKSRTTHRTMPPTRPRTTIKPLTKPMLRNVAPAKTKGKKFMREDMLDEVVAFQMEELALCRDHDFGIDFDLEL